jgi:hypothetical protein
VKQTDATYIRDGEAVQTLYGVQEAFVSAGPVGSGHNDGSYYPEYIALTTGSAADRPLGFSPTYYTSGSSVNLNIKINTPGVTETRPANVAVRYLIRALP